MMIIDYGDEDYCHNDDTDVDDVDAQVRGGQAVGEEAEEAGEGGEGGRHQGEEQETVVKKTEDLNIKNTERRGETKAGNYE